MTNPSDVLAQLLRQVKAESNSQTAALVAPPDAQMREIPRIEDRIEFPQPSNKQRHKVAALKEAGYGAKAHGQKDNMTGYIFIGPQQNWVEGQYVDPVQSPLRVLLVEQLTTRTSDQTLGGRQIWNQVAQADGSLTNAMGDNAGIACASQTGIAPSPFYVGKEVTGKVSGKVVTHKIGHTRNEVTGEWTPLLNARDICATCPFNSGSWPIACASTWRWIVVVFGMEGRPEPFLAVIDGSNAGVQAALKGARENSSAAQKGGGAIPALESWQMVDPKKMVPSVTPKDKITPAHYPYVRAAINSTDLALAPKAIGNMTDSTAAEFAADETVDSYLLELPVSKVFPQSRPELVGEPVPVYPIEMTVTENGFMRDKQPNPTYVPLTYLAESPLTEEEYAAYLNLRTLYMNTYRDYYRATDNLERVQAVLDGSRSAVISTPAALGLPPAIAGMPMQLPQGAIPATPHRIGAEPEKKEEPTSVVPADDL